MTLKRIPVRLLPLLVGIPGGAQQDPVIRITVNLVQVDAVVTDRQGKVVTDLTVRDHEVLVRANTGSEAIGPVRPGQPPPLRPEQVRRTIAIFVDDLGLSFSSTHAVREGLKKFVQEQLTPR